MLLVGIKLTEELFNFCKTEYCCDPAPKGAVLWKKR